MAAAAGTVPAIYTVYAALIGVGGLVLGGVLSSFNDWGKDKRAAKREAVADQRELTRERTIRREETAWRWYENRATFERDTALQLQEEFFAFSRSFSAAMHEDEMDFRRAGKWGTAQLTASIDDELRRSTIALHRLRVRLFDQDLRDQIEQYISLCLKAMMQYRGKSDAAEARKQSYLLESESSDLFDIVNEKLGITIRKAFEAMDPYQVVELPESNSAPGES